MDLLQAALLAFGFALLGAGIKFVDSAFDDNLFSRRAAYVIAVLSGALMGVLIAGDQFAAALLFSIVIGVAVAKKIDNAAFIAGTLVAVAVALLLIRSGEFNVAAIAFLSAAAVIDELGNNLSDSGRVRSAAFAFFFRYRLTLELAMGSLVLSGAFPPIYWLALILFDAAYVSVAMLSARMLAARARSGRAQA
jgi:hypothetical protein